MFIVQVMYNRAYSNYCMGQAAEATRELEEAKRLSSTTSESRHKVISIALEKVKVSLSP